MSIITSLFALAIEPLAQRTQQSEEESVIIVGKESSKLSLYAHDLMSYYLFFYFFLFPFIKCSRT